MKTYTTVQGDLWDSIAYKTLGSVHYTDKLMAANRKCQQLRAYGGEFEARVCRVFDDYTRDKARRRI